MLDGVASANPGPLPDAAIRRLFERILDEARSVERAVMHGGDGKKKADSGTCSPKAKVL